MKKNIIFSTVVLITAFVLGACESISPFTEEYIDLGLPSGTLWRGQNEAGVYTYKQAISYNIPTEQQMNELIENCQWEWLKTGCKVTGPNGKSIVLPLNGENGVFGWYWTSTHAEKPEWIDSLEITTDCTSWAKALYFYGEIKWIQTACTLNEFPIRLVK